MAKTQDFTNFFKDVPFAFDTDAVTNGWKTGATFGERFTAISVEAATKSNDITTNTVKQSLALLHTATKAQDDPADYAKVVSDVATAQAELVKTHFEALGDVAKLAQNDTTELFTTTAQQANEQSGKAANEAGTKAKAAANKSANTAKAA